MTEEKSLHDAGTEEQYKGSDFFADIQAFDEEITPTASNDIAHEIAPLAPNIDTAFVDNPQPYPNVGLLTIKPANQVIEEAKNKPRASKLFGQLWYEHDVCILFSDSGLGKTILAYQIANAISSGNNAIDELINEAQPQKVLYFDFELSDQQFEERFKDELSGTHYTFSENLLRVEINADADSDEENEDFEHRMKQDIIACIEQTNAKVVIIDNITFMNADNEKARNAIPLMRWIKNMGRKYNLSVLVVAHTPKRNPSNPITKNDLAGSRNLYNFCDGCFAIGESSKGSSIRYIKELKQRHTKHQYESDNVIVCEITKPNNFTQFSFVGYGYESEHLRQLTNNDRGNMVESVKELSAKGKSQREIAKELGISPGTVNKYLKK